MGSAVLLLSSDFSVPRKKSKVTQTLFYNFTHKSFLCPLMANQGRVGGSEKLRLAAIFSLVQSFVPMSPTQPVNLDVPEHKNTFPA